MLEIKKPELHEDTLIALQNNSGYAQLRLHS